jgi:hypothetical protein
VLVVQIADEDAYALLAYIEGVARHGYALSTDELEHYAEGRERKIFQRGELAAQFAKSVAASAAPWAGTVRVETSSEWLTRLGWIASQKDGLQITGLGRAVLRELQQQELKEELPLDVTLSPDDPVAYARVIERIAKHRNAMLVDAYFRLDDLLTLVQYTSVARILTSTRGKDGPSRVAGLATGVTQLKLDRPFEIRTTDDIHDRFVIPRTGDVDSLGTSLTGVGKRLSVMVRLKEPTASLIRTRHEAAWEGGKSLGPTAEAGETTGDAAAEG